MIFTVMENKQSVLFALNDFKKETPLEIPTILEQYLEFISRSGQTLFEWSHLRPLFVYKLDKVSSEFYLDHPTDQYPPRPNTDNPSFTELKQRILKQIDNFQGTPFTIQRLCELILNPRKYYKRPDKFMRGIERACMVVSTVDPYGNKIHSEDPRFFHPVGTLPINGSDNELWTFPNINSSTNSNSPPLEDDNAATVMTSSAGQSTDSIQTTRPTTNLVSNGKFSDSSATTLPWGNPGEVPVNESEPGVHNFAPDEEEDYDDSSTDNEEGEIIDQSVKSNSPNQASLESVQNESNNADPSLTTKQPPSNLSSEQLTVSLPTDVAGKLNDLPATRSPSSSPTNSSDLRPIGQLEAFVQNVSESGGFVERLTRSVSPGRCAFTMSGERAVSDEEDDIAAASPAKKRRISPQAAYSPPKLLSSPQSSTCTKEISTDSIESLSLPNSMTISPTKSSIQPPEVEKDSLKVDNSECDSLVAVEQKDPEHQFVILEEGGALTTAENQVVSPTDCHSKDLNQTESNPTALLNDDSMEAASESPRETPDELSDNHANPIDPNASDSSSTFRDEESGEMDSSGFSSNQNRSQPVNIDLETGEQQ